MEDRALDERRLAVAHGERLQRVPRGADAAHPRADLLRHTGLTTWQEWKPAAWLGTAAAQKRVVEFLRASRPLRDWLDVHVGPSAQ